jgi:hypothetical protein
VPLFDAANLEGLRDQSQRPVQTDWA